MMRKQRTSCTMTSYDNLTDWSSVMGSVNYENPSYENYLWPQFMTFDPDQISNSYQDVFPYDYSAAGDVLYQDIYAENAGESQTVTDGSYLLGGDSWNQSEAFTFPEQSVDESYCTVPDVEETAQQDYFEEPFQSQFLQYGSPTITDYGTVALLLRHLIRVDMTHEGAVSVYNYPATSAITINSAGSKCYIKHPNALIYVDGSVIHMMTGGDRMVKMSRRGVTFSNLNNSLAYFVDESGTKTTTKKFADLSSQDLTMDVFYDGGLPSHGNIEEECYKMTSEATYRNFSDGSETWNLGKIRIKQDRWGEVSVTQNKNALTISTSPTIRNVNVDNKPSMMSINIDCFSRNYLTVKKDSNVVTSAYCGLVVHNRSQKSGLDHNGKLVLF